MDIEQARSYLVHSVQADLERRRRFQQSVDEVGADIGAAANLLRDRYGTSRAELARLVGVAPATLGDLMMRARDAGTTIDDPIPLIPVLKGHELAAYITDHGPVDRVVAAFSNSDVVHLSGVGLGRFPHARIRKDGAPSTIPIPGMMMHLADRDDWIGIDNVSVGYGGTGPSNAERALLAAGVDPDIAKTVAYQNRVTDVRLDGATPEWLVATRTWPHMPVGTPVVIGDRYVVRINQSVGLRERTKLVPLDGDDPTAGRALPRDVPGSPLERWIKLFDDPACPDWVNGLRKATIYTNRRAAEHAGFAAEDAGLPPEAFAIDRFPHATPQIIIEQGATQLWVAALASDDPTQWLPSEFYDVLKTAGVFPADIAARDAQGALRKWLSGHRSAQPDEITVNGGITWAPRNNQNRAVRANATCDDRPEREETVDH